MNMFKPVKPSTIEEYLAAVPPERQEIINYMHKLIQDTVPGLKPHFAYNMLGYGSFLYKNYKKEDIAWPVIALGNQKNYVSLYVCSARGGKYLAEEYKDRLGKVSVGKSCIRFKKLEDLNLDELKALLRQASEHPKIADT
ncbi:MAG: DUF1801 domain-containing protein [Candidatus Saccharimonadales bacterium]